jgi:ABC-2 type transport system permease protein
MSELYTVVRREFVERVRSRSFAISTILLPLIVVATYAIPAMAGGGGGGTRHVVVVDETKDGVGASIAAALQAPRADAEATRYQVDRIPGPLETVRADLTRRVQAEQIDGYLWLPADVVQRGEVTYRARSVSNFQVLGDMRRAASQGVQGVRLRQAGLDAGAVAGLVKPVEVKTSRITKTGEEGGSAMSNFVVAYVASFLMYFMLIFYAVNVMRSVLDEKTNRISEVLVSSVRASTLMMGKILGVGSVALFQIAIWAGTVTVIATQTDWVARRFHLPPGALASVSLDPMVGIAIIAFFLLGFFLYAALYAALGAAMSTEQEAQQFQFFVLMPLMAPMFVFTRLAAEPMGHLATVMGMIPFTAPITMVIRMSAVPVPLSQVALSLAGLVLAIVAVAWIAGKIYRVGILSTGKKPSFSDLVRWLRAA